jgi:thiamine-monophosphate kinase
VGSVVFENKLPVDMLTFKTLKDMNIVSTTIALNGGEDYELLFTVAQKDYEALKNVEDVSVIGYIKEEAAGNQLITNDDRQIELRAQGFGEIR